MKMIHAYDEYYLDLTQNILGSMLELSFHFEKINSSDFINLFLNSYLCKAIEEGDPIVITSKSPNELLGILLNKDPLDVVQNEFASPEFWAGHVLAYVQWYTNRTFKEILDAFSIDELIENYFPYHEMDISKITELIISKLDMTSPLKKYRRLRKLSQNQLAFNSGVSLRTIRAYEQETLDLRKAQGETLYKLARALSCSMEDLM